MMSNVITVYSREKNQAHIKDHLSTFVSLLLNKTESKLLLCKTFGFSIFFYILI